VITAESLIEQVKEKVREKIKDREFSAEEKENIAEMVAIGAIKYSILRQAIGGDIVFDFDKSISFEGDSGPYLQYSYVRAKSVLEKADPEKNVFSKKSSGLLASLGQTFFSKSFFQDKITRPEGLNIQEVEKILYRFPEVVERAGREYAPHHLVTYLTELASAFNSFYGNEKIIDPSTLLGAGEISPASAYKIALTEATAHVLKNGLHLLGIKAPERM
jgi:arginyl-tRNA synthetase